MSNPNNTLRGWLSTAAVIAGTLALYLSTAMITVLLTGSAVISALVSNAVLFAAGILWLRSEQHRTSTGSPAGNPGGLSRGPGFWAQAVIALTFCWLVGQAASVWLYGLVGSPGFDEHVSTKAQAPLPLMLLLVLVLAPMGEEMLMRGVVYSWLRRHMAPLAAALLSTGLFSLMHLNLVQIVVTLPLGLLLAVVYERTGRLTPVIMMHAVFNLFSAVFPAALVASFASLTFVLLGGVALALLLVLLYRAPGAEPTESAPSPTESGVDPLGLGG
jgi:uncharacterized protein